MGSIVPQRITRSTRNLTTAASALDDTSTAAEENQCSITGEPLILRRSLGLREDYVALLAPNQVAQRERTLAHAIFGERLKMYEINVNKKSPSVPEQSLERDGSIFHLLSTKLHKKQSNFAHCTASVIKAQYVMVSGPDVPTIDLKSILESWAGFGRLKTNKVAARLQLLQSTAMVKNGKSVICKNLNSSDIETIPEIEEIPEIAHEGCGFMPVGFASIIVGRGAVGQRTFAIQVRILSSKHGLFKGVLVEKPGISTLQLPSSMKKVGTSEIPGESKVILLVNSLFPGKSNAL